MKIDMNQIDNFVTIAPTTSGKLPREKTQKMKNHTKKKIEHQNTKKVWKNKRNRERQVPVILDQVEQVYSQGEIEALYDHDYRYGCYCHELVEYEYYGYNRYSCEYTKRRAIYTECDNCKNSRDKSLQKNRKVTYNYTFLMPWGFEKVSIDKFTL